MGKKQYKSSCVSQEIFDGSICYALNDRRTPPSLYIPIFQMEGIKNICKSLKICIETCKHVKGIRISNNTSLQHNSKYFCFVNKTEYYNLCSDGFLIKQNTETRGFLLIQNTYFFWG